MVNKQRGFTLIELLVVIAIIGILSSVVLASLNTARGKGNDAKVKAQLSGARASAEIYYDSNGKYNTTAAAIAPSAAGCATASSMFIDSTSGMLSYTTVGNYPASTVIKCSATAAGDAYAISANLNTTGQYWCVDSKGASKGVTTDLASTVCPAS